MPLAIQGIDEAVLLWIQEAVRQAWLDPVVKAFTTLGNAGILWLVLSVAMAVLASHPGRRDCWRAVRSSSVCCLPTWG